MIYCFSVHALYQLCTCSHIATCTVRGIQRCNYARNVHNDVIFYLPVINLGLTSNHTIMLPLNCAMTILHYILHNCSVMISGIILHIATLWGSHAGDKNLKLERFNHFRDAARKCQGWSHALIVRHSSDSQNPTFPYIVITCSSIARLLLLCINQVDFLYVLT